MKLAGQVFDYYALQWYKHKRDDTKFVITAERASLLLNLHEAHGYASIFFRN